MGLAISLLVTEAAKAGLVATIRQNLIQAIRALSRRPRFALVVIVTFALGIGASTAIVSAVHPILFAPLPYPGAERLVSIWDIDADGDPFEVTYGTYVELAERSRSFEALAVADRWRPSLADGALDPERLEGDRVSADYFRALGVALLGERLTESLVLAALGGLVGLVVALAGIRMFVAWAPPGLPRIDAIAFDARVFVVALGITAFVGLAVGVPPALQAMRTELRLSVQSGARAIGRGDRRLRRALVVAQVALALILLVGAGLLLRSMERISATAPGFETSGVLTMQVVASGRSFASNDEALRLFEGTLEAARNVPGVTDAAYVSQLPLSGDLDVYGASFESAPLGDARSTGGAVRYAVTPDWFRTMGIPLVEGRFLDSKDRPSAPVAVVISESFAKRRFGDRSPIGERVRFGPQIGAGEWSTIVGVVGDVRHASLALPAPDAFYVAIGQWRWVDEVNTLVVRSARDPQALVPEIRRAIWSVDSSLPLVRIATMADVLSASEFRRTFALTVFSAFSAAALALATLGIYGVVAGSVAERTREMGLRAALGATRRGLLRLVVGQGMMLTAIGIGIGLLGAIAASRGLTSLLFGVDPLDAPTYVAVVVLVLSMAAVASLLPASRAARSDPTAALRSN